MERKKKLKVIQFILLIFGVSLIYLTYYDSGKENSLEEEILSKTTQEKIKKQNLENPTDDRDIFYNVEYTGLDLTGNRYLIKSKEAYLDKINSEIVYMQDVSSIFYFKDDTVLYVYAEKGIYNNKTLNMIFKDNVNAKYLDNELFANNAEYSNTESYLKIYGKVKINNKRGNLVADKLLFDITKQQLDISSLIDNEINVNLKLNEK
tara:strand:- start:266 stop:883 length:618 start_codon:yes stop_codon:yes gene_type:complete